MDDRVAALHSRIRIPAQLTIAGLWVMAALSLVRVLTTPILRTESSFPVLAALSLLLVLGWVYTAVAFITWLFLARENLDRRGETGFNWRKGWTVGGWFIPLANLVIPWRVVGEVYARSAPGAYRTWRMPALVSWWWVALILSVFRFTYTETDLTTRTQVVHFVPFWNLVNGAFGVVAALLAIQLVRRVTAWQAQWRPPR